MLVVEEDDLRLVPTYSLGDVARFLRLPKATVRSWVMGRPYPTQDGRAFFEPLIRAEKTKPVLLSFLNLVELHVLSAMRRRYMVKLDKVREALLYGSERLDVDRPLAHQVFFTDGVDLFVKESERLLNVSKSGQVELRRALEEHLKRIERDDTGLAVRLFPFTRKETGDTPRMIVIDPSFSFGQPSLVELGIPTGILADRYKAGESIGTLARDYGCSGALVEEAIRWELPLAA